MSVITLDYESYYDKDYSLRKMTNEEYIRDPRFHCHGVGVQIDDKERYYYPDTDDIPRRLGELELHKHAVVSHHAHFDMAILNWHHGIRPAFIIDTLSMARPLFPTASLKLADLAPMLGVGEKGTEIADFEGVERLTVRQQEVMKKYCLDGDVHLTYEIYLLLVKRLPIFELRVIDQLVREFTEPVFQVNIDIARAEAEDEQAQIDAVLLATGVETSKQLSSNKQFAEILDGLGVDVPMKISPTTKKETFAFAKKDEGFKLLMEHPDETIRTLIDARLRVKSTIKLTRSTRFVEIGERGLLPSYSLYYGAHTGRPSGGDKLNLKNLPHSSQLRHAMGVPKGWVIVMRDLGQIEARMIGYVGGQEDLMQAFRDGKDPYCHEAGKIYGYEILKHKHPMQRTVGKIVVLGCGYQMGWRALQAQLRIGFMGIAPITFGMDYVDELNVPLELYTSQRWFNRTVSETLLGHMDLREHVIHCAVTRFLVESFRKANDKVVNLWGEADDALYDVMSGKERFIGHNELVKTGPHGITLTPYDMPIHYTNLRQQYDKERQSMSKVYDKRQGYNTINAYIYGGKVVENFTQGLSYILIKENKLTLSKDFRVAMDVYDEILCVVPEDEAEDCAKRMSDVMTTPPTWAPDLPLKSSGGYADNYGDCEK